MTATNFQVAAERERQDYAAKQSSIAASLATYEPLFTWRLEVVRPGDQLRIYFSPIGVEFTPVSSDEGDDVLVSWAHPGFLNIRTLALGETGFLSSGRKVEWKLAAKTELGREDRDVALYDLKVLADGELETLFEEVRFSDDGPIATVARPRVAQPAEVEAEVELGADLAEPAEIRASPRLFLDSVVRNREGRAVAIPFALDERQWGAMARYAGEGTILMTGPPGTGKTTVALLRATTLIHSTFEYDDQQNRVSDRPVVDLRKSRFRIVVVTEHLKGYLKEFLSSTELGLPEAQVVNLRGAFLGDFVRHKTLSTWIRGLRFRLSKAKNQESDVLTYIKALPATLKLCFYHAVLNAHENVGDGCQGLAQRVFDRVYDSIVNNALSKILSDKQRVALNEEEQIEGFDFDAFIRRYKLTEAYEEYVTPRLTEVRTALIELRGFASSWVRKATDRCELSIDSSGEVWLTNEPDELLLSRFVEGVTGFRDFSREKSMFIRDAWRELVQLVDPQEVLLRVIADYERTGEIGALEKAGLSKDDAFAALSEWRKVLKGQTADLTAEEVDLDSPDDGLSDEDSFDGSTLIRRKGSLTRSDFPLLASMARVFLALPPEAAEIPDVYKGVGFVLPGELVRYDHVIIDEGQDFTYAEINLVRSLVEHRRNAVTISGDPFQRMDWRYGFSSLESVQVSEERRFHITRNYRQTVELANWICKLGGALFNDPSLVIESTHQHGPRPTVLVEGTLRKNVRLAAAAISKWYDNDRNPFVATLLIGFGHGQVSQITNTLSDDLEESAIHAERVEDGRHIERGTVAVADVPTVKGLEFDGVVVVVSKEACRQLGESTPQANIAKNMVYVACSRAKRHLTVLLQEDIALLRESELY